jgi:hypothetical protein
MKLLVGSGIVLEELTRLKLRSVLVDKSIHSVNVLSNAHLVQVSKGSAAEWCKAGTKDQANITNDGIGNDFVFQALGGFVDKSVRNVSQQRERMRGKTGGARVQDQCA